MSEKEPYKERPLRHTFAVALLGALAICNAYANYDTATTVLSAYSSKDPRDIETSAIVSAITDHPVAAACKDIPDVSLTESIQVEVSGRVSLFRIALPFKTIRVAPPVMTLNTSICDTLTTLNSTTSSELTYDQEMRQASAILVAIHEDEHIRQVLDEAVATCYSAQKLPIALDRAGFNPDTIEAVASDIAASQLYIRPPNYLSTECAPGNELDLGISDIYTTPTEEDLALLTRLIKEESAIKK
jgi:hypothetical protein